MYIYANGTEKPYYLKPGDTQTEPDTEERMLELLSQPDTSYVQKLMAERLMNIETMNDKVAETIRELYFPQDDKEVRQHAWIKRPKTVQSFKEQYEDICEPHVKAFQECIERTNQDEAMGPINYLVCAKEFTNYRLRAEQLFCSNQLRHCATAYYNATSPHYVDALDETMDPTQAIRACRDPSIRQVFLKFNTDALD
eukprot:CAMPEP_0117433178 /NCGR_PEP_ID=MMETSP0758-20121206/12566_1 /TAXON_ID=63605 /ORGANISM="Percolomonas cosmopolitus, Strain AE-1 (ATCC 50343)" /LENGTH=196 /DNA_ID=CAMNT_0005223635 /DNA_START=261 /DNA_END=848 /DNA_ORIENTATION=+